MKKGGSFSEPPSPIEQTDTCRIGLPSIAVPRQAARDPNRRT
jgi:hypothetical protein